MNAAIGAFIGYVLAHVVVEAITSKYKRDPFAAARKESAEATRAQFAALFEAERQHRARFRAWWESQGQEKEPWE